MRLDFLQEPDNPVQGLRVKLGLNLDALTTGQEDLQPASFHSLLLLAPTSYDFDRDKPAAGLAAIRGRRRLACQIAFERAQCQLALPAELTSIHSASLELFYQPSHFSPAAPLAPGNRLLLFCHPLTQPEFRPRGKVVLV
jgi:hypothetical protein